MRSLEADGEGWAYANLKGRDGSTVGPLMVAVGETRQMPVLIRHSDAIMHIVLNRPEVINSLTLDMVRTIADTLGKARNDNGVKLIIFSGEGERGFCAGGDIKLLARGVMENTIEPAMQFLKEENDLDLAIHRYPKPVVVFAHGITMGGGLGLSAGADITIASQNTRMAMPETRIGFFPDVGATGWLFLKCRDGYPEFLGLTGYEMTGTECVRIGLADCLIPSSRFSDAMEVLERHAPALPAHRKAAADSLRDVLNPFEQKDIPENPEMDEWVEEYFAGKSSVLDILSALKVCSTQNDLCEGVFSRLSERSPSAVVVTLRRLRGDEGRDLKEVFQSDLKVARYLMAQHDFREGVRARLIDKDDRPKWDPDSFEKAALMANLMPIDS
jgi:enoyl-CoA hydratase